MNSDESLLELRLLERAVERELHRMERLRATIAAGFIVVAIVVIALVFALRAEDFEAVMVRPQDRWLVLLAPSLYLPFILRLRRHIERHLAEGRPLQRWRSYVAVSVELSLPTVAAGLFSLVTSPVAGLHSPPIFLYPLMIVIWTLALDWRLCLYAGALATFEYLGLFLVQRDAALAELPGSLLTATAPFLVRTAVIAATGVVAALVASQLRRRVIGSLRAVHEQARIRQVFGQHVSPEVAQAILDRGGADTPQERRICVLFLDVRGFTSFSEAHPAEEVVDYLNRLLDPLLDAVARHGGVVNKLLGDGFMALFGAPVPDPRAEASALAAARELLEIVDELVARGEIPATTIGIGLHAGPAITGNVGSSRRKEYTVIGDTVNLASRIEGLNKQFGSRLLASAAVVDAAGLEDVGEALGPVEIRGRAEAVVLHRLA